MSAVNEYKKRYKSLMVKAELKDEMDRTIGRIGEKMSYSDLIWRLLKEYKNGK